MSNGLQTLVSSRHVSMRACRLGIDSRADHIIYMREDCDICRSEGFSAQARVRVSNGPQFIIATVHHITSELVAMGEAGLSEAGWMTLGLEESDAIIHLSHPAHRPSLSKVRGKIYGQSLDGEVMDAIIRDIVRGRYSDVEMAAFVTGCTARDLDDDERIALTAAMVNVGEKLDWGAQHVVDKHCVGGLPGNRTTPIVVAIVAANGLVMPKTSSRAITSPAGTADTMETLTRVDLDIREIRRVVEAEGACLAWGGAVRLSPADDLLIRVERALEIDSDGQLVASVLSKKIAAGSTHLVLDIPYGLTAKVRSLEAAKDLEDSLLRVSNAFDLRAEAILSDGSQPVGRGIGPALEASDVLAVLKRTVGAPDDLAARSIVLAARLLEMAGAVEKGGGEALAAETLKSGLAWQKFLAICEAQGGFVEPPEARIRNMVVSNRDGRVAGIDNRRLAQAAKLLGAPDAKAAGIYMEVRLGDQVAKGQPLYGLHSESHGEMAYAAAYVEANRDMIVLEHEQ